MKKLIFFIGTFMLLTSCYQHHDKEIYIKDFLSAEDYNEFFKKHYNESYLFINSKKIKDYNQYFKPVLEDFKRGYSVILTGNKFYSYQFDENNMEDEYLVIIVISNSNNRVAIFEFAKNKNMDWIFTEIIFE